MPRPAKRDPLEDIYISRKMMLWLIRYFTLLKEGFLPPGVKAFPPLVKKGGSSDTPFEVAVEYAIEVERRLLRAHLDGLILLCIECFKISEASLAAFLGMDEESIRRRSEEALTYVTGYSQKKRSYRTHYQHKRANR